MDVMVTLCMWVYFTAGFFFLFLLPGVLPALLLARDREAAFQRLINRFCRGFFALCRCLTPGLRMEISEEARAVRGAVVVCNHLSYLDPMLFASLYARNKTIVKEAAMAVPILGWVIRIAGYLPSRAGGRFSAHFLRQVQSLPSFAQAGGNLFVFPEGTRSRDGTVGPFASGAFKLARQAGLPIEMLWLQDADSYFGRGKVLLNTCVPLCIRVERIGRIEPDYEAPSFTMRQLLEQVEDAYRQRSRGALPSAQPQAAVGIVPSGS
jgi:1-acyl-sn-glycerol-3-phosphate acyltransferase